MRKPIPLLILMVLALWACVKELQATQVLIAVESELGSDAASYEVRVTDPRETAMGQRDVITRPPPFSFALVPARKSPVSTNLIIVSALDASGNVIAVSKALVTFRERASVQVSVRLTQACRGRLCAAGFSCDPAGGECVELQATQGTEVDPVTPGETTIEGMTPGEDGGAGSGGSPGGDASTPTAQPGMAGGAQSMGGGASPMGGTGGATAGGTTMGGTGDAGAPPECDETRTCSSGYTCTSGQCVSRCAQTTCDPNATCSLNTSGAPVCACKTGYLTTTGAGAPSRARAPSSARSCAAMPTPAARLSRECSPVASATRATWAPERAARQSAAARSRSRTAASTPTARPSARRPSTAATTAT